MHINKSKQSRRVKNRNRATEILNLRAKLENWCRCEKDGYHKADKGRFRTAQWDLFVHKNTLYQPQH